MIKIDNQTPREKVANLPRKKSASEQNLQNDPSPIKIQERVRLGLVKVKNHEGEGLKLRIWRNFSSAPETVKRFLGGIFSPVLKFLSKIGTDSGELAAGARKLENKLRTLLSGIKDFESREKFRKLLQASNPETCLLCLRNEKLTRKIIENGLAEDIRNATFFWDCDKEIINKTIATIDLYEIKFSTNDAVDKVNNVCEILTNKSKHDSSIPFANLLENDEEFFNEITEKIDQNTMDKLYEILEIASTKFNNNKLNPFKKLQTSIRTMERFIENNELFSEEISSNKNYRKKILELKLFPRVSPSDRAHFLIDLFGEKPLFGKMKRNFDGTTLGLIRKLSLQPETKLNWSNREKIDEEVRRRETLFQSVISRLDRIGVEKKGGLERIKAALEDLPLDSLANCLSDGHVGKIVGKHRKIYRQISDFLERCAEKDIDGNREVLNSCAFLLGQAVLQAKEGQEK